jgi:hypothetical protein
LKGISNPGGGNSYDGRRGGVRERVYCDRSSSSPEENEDEDVEEDDRDVIDGVLANERPCDSEE